VTEATWSRSGGSECIRLAGVPAGADVRVFPGTVFPGTVFPGTVFPGTGGWPPMAGRLDQDGPDWCFVPRFAFLDGTSYTVMVEGTPAAVLVRARPERPAVTEVTGIRPTAAEVPVNLLRLYVWFSAPMSEGYAAGQVRIARDDGSSVPGALLPSEHELWDGSRRRLTVLLDPARIKRGLPGHQQAGYPLRSGQPFRLVVGDGFRDAQGLPLRSPAERRYEVGGEERRHVDPAAWALAVPPAGTREPLRVTFGRPLDHGLLGRCLQVRGPGLAPVDGTARTGPGERSWSLAPNRAWAAAVHHLVVDPVLEDLAGNSVSRVFDRDLTRPADQPRPARPVTIAFSPA